MDVDVIDEVIEDAEAIDEDDEKKKQDPKEPAVTFRAVDVSGALFSSQGTAAITTRQAKFERLASYQKRLQLAERRTRVNVDLPTNPTRFIRDNICIDCPANKDWDRCSSRAKHERRFFCLALTQMTGVHVRLYYAKSMELNPASKETRLARAIVSFIKRTAEPPTKTQIVESVKGAKFSLLRDIIDQLEADGKIHTVRYRRGRQMVTGYVASSGWNLPIQIVRKEDANA